MSKQGASDRESGQGKDGADLLERVALMSCVRTALAEAFELYALSEVMLGALASRKTFGFSRAAIFHWDPSEEVFRGLNGLGAPDRETHDRLQAQDEAEPGVYGSGNIPAEAASKDLEPGASALEDERRFLALEAAQARRAPPWTDLFAAYRQTNPLGDAVKPIQFKLGGGPDSASGKGEAEFFASLFRGRACHLLQPCDSGRLAAVPKLKEIFPVASLWTGISTQAGPQMILVVDKLFEPSSALEAIDRERFDWFAARVRPALENVAMVAGLKETNVNLQELDTLKGNFLSIISHELRTPLTAINGFSHLLLDNKGGQLTPAQRDIVARVMVHGDRLTNVVNDLIEIVEIDSGSALHMDRRPVDALNILMESLPKHEPRRAGKSVTIEPVVTGPVPRILANRDGLGRIFYHLIDNATKFSKEHGRVRIEFEVKEPDLEIRIVDQGIGIAPEKLKLIFDAFYQVDSHITRVHEGMGIGLTLTNKLVTTTGGHLEVQSELNEGTTFTLRYPLA